MMSVLCVSTTRLRKFAVLGIGITDNRLDIGTRHDADAPGNAAGRANLFHISQN